MSLLNRDTAAGALFAGVGALGLWTGRRLNVGTADAMGEGYVPLLMCGVLLLLGVAMLAHGLRAAAPPMPRLHLRPVLAVTAAVLAFAALLEPLGVVAAILASALCAARAVRDVPLASVLLPTALLALLVLAIFVWGLGLPLRALPPWLVG